MNESLLVWAVGIVLTAAAVLPAILIRRAREREGMQMRQKALDYGLHEPVSLHPIVDGALCIGSGACVDACPEDVLAMVRGQAAAVAPARCVGHGLCERVCPMTAIRLVFGTATRGVELPRIRENFETNVDGIFIIGELGGMGLVRNAFEQGRQCVAGIAKSRGRAAGDMLDVVVIGCGPAGLSAALHLKKAGMRFVVLEKEPDVGGAVRHYPRRKLVMTHALEIPGHGRVREREISKERLISIWTEVARASGLPIVNDALVERIERARDHFVVHTPARSYAARRVILAIGRRGIPRRLGVPGEDGGNVYYGLAEPESFAGRRVLVVGGGDSAVEAALMLAGQPDTRVRLSYRRERLARVKPANGERFVEAVRSGIVTPLWSSQVRAIGERNVMVAAEPAGTTTIENDDVFVFIGGELPTKFLQETGIAMDTRFGTP
ncbi:MAG TPA: FAD-dependent oxidoreductase [Longimicrobiales bacterium]